MLDHSFNPLYSSSQETLTEKLLSNPQQLLPSLFDADDSDMVYFSCDLNRRFRYISKSARAVAGMDPTKWHGQNYLLTLTEHACNDTLKNCIEVELPPNHVQKLHCEIFADDGTKIRIEIRRQLILADGIPVGTIGIAKRAEILPMPIYRFDEAHTPFLKLTATELEVIELVVNGEMNKRIAKTLGVALRTVESRRSRAMAKLGVKTLPDLVRLWYDRPMQ
jgi:DNA-binding CsgD family transcriptional regulator